MAATTDELLKAIQELTKSINQANNASKKGGSSIGPNGQPIRKKEGVSDWEEEFRRGSNKGGIRDRFDYNARQRDKYLDLQKKAHNKKLSQGERDAAKAQANKTLKTTGKMNLYGAIAGAAADTIKQVADFYVKLKEFQFKQQKINLEAASKSLQVQNALYGSALSKAVSSGTTTLVGDLKENTYQAMKGVMEMGKQSLLSNISLNQIAFDKAADLQLLNLEKANMMVESTLGTVGNILSSIPNPYTMIAGAVVSAVSSIWQASNEIEMKKLEFIKEQKTALTEFKKDLIEQAYSAVQPIVDLTQSIDKLLMNLDNSAHAVGRNFGLQGQALDNYVKASAHMNLEMARLGKTFEELKKSQDAYISASGRNVLLNGTEGQMTSALDTLFNLGDGEAAGIMGAMNIFNTSIESGSDMMFAMYKTANKMGVSNQKFAKDMQKNLKLAEKYQFKGGVEGMMKMALWAQKTRFNMDSLASALEKMHTGNIEDVLQTSARLNVLGGNAAIFSDPMRMLYNAYANPQEYAENVNKMVSGFGTFDAKTGETTFNVNEQMRMEAMASALGMSKEDFFNQARQSKKSDQLRKLFGHRYSNDQLDLLTQHATYNRDAKEWQVNVMGENGKVTARSLSNLTPDELNSIFPEDNQEKLVKYTEGIFSLMQKQSVVENTNRATIMENTQGAHQEETLKQQAFTAYHYDRNMGKYTDEVTKGYSYATQSLEASLNMAENILNNVDENGSLADKYYKASIAGVNDVSSKITVFQNALGGMLTGNFQAILDAMAILNPEAAVEFSNARAMEMGMTNKSDENLDRWGEAIDLAQNADIENGSGQYNNDDFITNGYGYFDQNGNFYLNMSKNNGADYDNMGVLASQVEATGKYKVNRRTGKVTRANDLIISPTHGVHELDPEDTIVASKPGGSLDRSYRNGYGSSSITVNGTLRLDTGKQSVDLIQLLRENPNVLRDLTRELILEKERKEYGGKSHSGIIRR